MKNTYDWRDEFYQLKMAQEIADDKANLKAHRVRYTNDPRSLSAKRVRWYPRMFEGAVQNACSLVMMK